jgi:hypothetical protein
MATTDFPTAASHPFYRRLNQLLREHGFDDFAEAQCVPFYAWRVTRPPKEYFALRERCSRAGACRDTAVKSAPVRLHL